MQGIIRPVRIDHRIVLGIAAPMTLAHLSTPLLGLVDTAVIGQVGDPALIGAVALSAVLFDFLFWGFGFLRMGTAGLTAQALGAEDRAEQGAIFFRALFLAGVLGALIIATQKLIAATAFPLLGGSAAVTQAAELYFAIRVWSAPFALGNYAILGWLIGMGRTTTGLLLQIGINLLNIGLCIMFTLWFGWGVAGTALATTLAEIVGVFVGFAVVAMHVKSYITVPASRIFAKGQFTRMMVVNRDIMLRTVALLTAFMFFSRQGALAGDTILAANAILNNFFLVGGYFLDGIATAAEQLCGRSLGANNRRSFELAVRYSLGWSLVLALLISAILFFAGGRLIDIMTTSIPVRLEAHHFLIYASLMPLAGLPAFVFDGVFIGATWNRAMRDLMIVALLCFFVLWWLLLPLGNHGLWLAFVGFMLVRGAGQAIAYPRLLSRNFGTGAKCD